MTGKFPKVGHGTFVLNIRRVAGEFNQRGGKLGNKTLSQGHFTTFLPDIASVAIDTEGIKLYS